MPDAIIKNIKLLLLDVDGVLTDGSIIYDHLGNQLHRFNAKDGLAITAWQKLGLQLGIITARSAPALTCRLNELSIDLIEDNVANKLDTLKDICRRQNISLNETAYMGDDLADLAVMTNVAYPIAPADAVAEIKQIAKFTTTAPGGHGAVRQAIEHLLNQMNRWNEVLNYYK